MIKNLLKYSILVCGFLFFLLYTKGIGWLPFLLIATFYIYIDFFRTSETVSIESDKPIKLGEFGYYLIQGEKSYRFYMRVDGNEVFVDIKEDEYIEDRILYAKRLLKNEDILSNSLKSFTSGRNHFSGKSISYIGLHSKNLKRGEVFWHPDGYTILDDLVFSEDEITESLEHSKLP